MSHKSGKIEILGFDDDNVYMRYHRAADSSKYNRVLSFTRDESARWLGTLLGEELYYRRL